MNNREILELVCLVKSCKNNLSKKYNGEYEEKVDEVCEKFCKKHNINITHGTAYKELRHKTYYYINKNIQSIADYGEDKYKLYKNGAISATAIVDYLLENKIKEWEIK